MPIHQYVAFDLGAESGRSILATLDAGALSLTETHRFANPTSRINGHYHWNLLSQWEELKTGLKKSLAAARLPLSGIGVDTWGVDFGLLTGTGELLSAPFMYRDPRTDGMMEKTFAIVPKNEVFRVTGIQFMQFNTLFQLMAMRESPLLKAADKLLFMPDLFHYLFTGKAVAEYSIASTSQMLDANSRSWANPMLAKLGLPTHILPEIVPSGSIVGLLQRTVTDELQCAPLPVIAPAAHDTASAVVAVPVQGGDPDGRMSGTPDWCYISSGTWSLMGVELTAPLINDTSLSLNYTNEGGYGNTIRFLKNIMGLWLVQECRRHFQKEGKEHSYAELTAMAAASKPLVSLINPDHSPFLTPGDMPGKIAAFCRTTKQPIPDSVATYIRTCLDSLALTYRRTLDGLEKVLGRQIKTIHIVGGGTQNELLNQMTADACNREVIAGPVEATAIGNLLVQALATGAVKNLAEARAIVSASFLVKRYTPRDVRAWDLAYERYGELI
jgi:rhamnulokinase